MKLVENGFSANLLDQERKMSTSLVPCFCKTAKSACGGIMLFTKLRYD